VSLLACAATAAVLSAATAVAAAADDRSARKLATSMDAAIRHGRYRQIRTTEPRLRRALDDGVRRSASFRALVRRLEHSDVVVYLRCSGERRSNVGGRLTFVSAAGGFRYVLVQLARLEPRAQQVAMLAHELQHAVEIADAPAVVDSESLAREYERIGHVSQWSAGPRVAFDTHAAIDMGRQVLWEVTSDEDD
jgi:hypothetical protein